MDLALYSYDPLNPLLILKLPKLNIIVNCPDIKELKRVNWPTIDIVLLTNEKSSLGVHMVRDLGFSGRIISSDPVKEFLKLIYLDSSEAELFVAYDKGYQQKYSKKRLECLEDIETCSPFSQIDLGNGYQAIPCLSGISIGSCNYVIRKNEFSVAILGKSSLAERHPSKISFRRLNQQDLFIITHIKTNDSVVVSSLKEIGQTLIQTIKNQGIAIFPCMLTEYFVDLLLFITEALKATNLTVPIYIYSKAAKSYFKFLDIYSEFTEKQFASKAFLAEEPFPFKKYIESGFIQFKTELDFNLIVPCVIISTCLDLQSGMTRELLDVLGQDKNNSLIFTDPSTEQKSFDSSLKCKIQTSFIDYSLDLEACQKIAEYMQVKVESVVYPLKSDDQYKYKDLIMLSPFKTVRIEKKPDFSVFFLDHKVANQLQTDNKRVDIKLDLKHNLIDSRQQKQLNFDEFLKRIQELDFTILFDNAIRLDLYDAIIKFDEQENISVDLQDPSILSKLAKYLN